MLYIASSPTFRSIIASVRPTRIWYTKIELQGSWQGKQWMGVVEVEPSGWRGDCGVVVQDAVIAR